MAQNPRMSRRPPDGGGGGSLASRSDVLLQGLFRRKQQPQQQAVTIEIHDDDGVESRRRRQRPGKASPLADCEDDEDERPSSSSPAAVGSSHEQSPRTPATTTADPSPKSKSSPGASSSGVATTAGYSSSAATTQPATSSRQSVRPFPVEPSEEDSDARPQGLVMAVASKAVVMRRSKNQDCSDSSPSLNGQRRTSQARRLRHRASAGRSGSPTEAGRLLRRALARHFDQGQDDELDDYVCEVFRQLDYHRRGTVSREDFETLCEVLGLPSDPPTPPPRGSHRNSGLEWLSTYRPRPDSPALSPLRIDKLGEVKFRQPLSGKKTPPVPSVQQQSPPNFLFTLGERPFWEMWPQRKWTRKRRKLTLDEFKRSLLEQWAKSQGLPQTAVGTVLPVADRRRRLGQGHKFPDLIEKVDGARQASGNKPIVRVLRVRSETRTKKILRNLRRATRRYRFLDRLSRVTKSGSKPSALRSRSPSQNVGNGAPAATQTHSYASANGTVSGTEHPRRRLSKLDNLRARVADQQEEIGALRDVVQDLRSSLQLSDAQNLALQVLLRKVARAEGQLLPPGSSDRTQVPNDSVHYQGSPPSSSGGGIAIPGTLRRHSRHSFRSRMDESERQLENLVRELKEMSQVRYPVLQQGTASSNNQGGTASSSCSATNVFFPPAAGATASASDEVDAAAVPTGLEEEQLLGETAEALGGAGTGLKAAQDELSQTAER